jgi:hypothetical protein
MSSKRRKPAESDLPPIFDLRQQMSEIISLREKVARAELAARQLGSASAAGHNNTVSESKETPR